MQIIYQDLKCSDRITIFTWVLLKQCTHKYRKRLKPDLHDGRIGEIYEYLDIINFRLHNHVVAHKIHVRLVDIQKRTKT